VLGPSGGGADPGQVVGEVGRSAGHRTASQQLVEDRGGCGNPFRGSHRWPAKRVGEVEPVDGLLDDAAGDELAPSWSSSTNRPFWTA
jgi:hypothetical protein